MDSFGADEDDRESEGSSDNDQDGPMEEREDEDMEGNEVPDAYADGEGENEEENEDEDDEQDPDQDQDDSQDSIGNGPNRGQKSMGASQTSVLGNMSEPLQDPNNSRGPPSAPTSHPNPSMLLTSPSPTQGSTVSNGYSNEFPKIRPEAVTASVYDIVPTIAAPHSTSINSITATPDLRWVFTGGHDGYIRKFNFLETANGKSALTVAQRHPFVDSVTKAGVLVSYWENNEELNGKSSDDGSSISSVYSLAVQREGLWLLSGLESGGINLQSVRHDEGKRIACLRGHTSAVSVLNLAQDETSVLSGSWDKVVLDWDLNTGKTIRKFEGSGGQISALEIRPLSSLPVPEASGDIAEISNTLSTDTNEKPRPNGILDTGVDGENTRAMPSAEPANNGDEGSPNDSLFGDGDSLFGDNDNDFTRMIANGIQEHQDEQEHGREDQDTAGDTQMPDADRASTATLVNGESGAEDSSKPEPAGDQIACPGTTSSSSTGTLANGLPHAEELPQNGETAESKSTGTEQAPQTSDSTFLAAGMDGSLRIWDKRQTQPIAKMLPGRNVPPWCTSAVWSPDGNFIYAGRRNGTVDEYSLHKGLRAAERSFKLPNNSGAVSALRAMPNGRHLICASHDILRLYDLQEKQIFKHATVPFLIVPGHRTGVVSHLYMDPTCRYLISAAGNRGWEGSSTEVMLGYEIGVPKS
ncbi:hypothetical protein N7G274_003526 [Stereocaulon virgatum]|uniref:Transcription factor spt8 beta-propeller domain-containing protein n=1 Tax=Stereocaulon virgatum TaxID=373712 RepID=A0ABR4AEX6_9LECA